MQNIELIIGRVYLPQCFGNKFLLQKFVLLKIWRFQKFSVPYTTEQICCVCNTNFLKLSYLQLVKLQKRDLLPKHWGKYTLSIPGSRLGEEWQAIARVPQHVPKIILGALLSPTLDIKIACLVLIFKLQH